MITPLSRRIWHMMHILLILLVLASVAAVRWPLFPVYKGHRLYPVALGQDVEVDLDGDGFPDDFASLPNPVVQRTIDALSNIPRGNIYDRNENLLANNCPDPNGGETRCYTNPSLVHTVGLISYMGLGIVGPGQKGAERAYNETLLGLNRLDGWFDDLVNRPTVGSHLYLTIDSDIQEAATTSLAGRAGAVVVLDAQTGTVLAMTSAPAFDPNQLLSDGNYYNTLINNCDGSYYCRDPFWNRATHGSYPPGSTWKIVTTMAALESGLADPAQMFYFGLPLEEPERLKGCYTYEVDNKVILDCNHKYVSELSLADSFVVSANSTFNQLGDSMDAETMREYALKFGVGSHESLPFELGSTYAQLANEPEELNNSRSARAYTAMGQGEMVASPLHMALVAATVVNGGDVPTPHLLYATRSPEGEIKEVDPPNAWHASAINERTAEQLHEMMVAVITDTVRGTGFYANPNIPGFIAGGKTGTAENNTAYPHAWFVGFMQNETTGKAVAIAIIVEHAGEGSQVAAPVFAQVAGASVDYLSQQP